MWDFEFLPTADYVDAPRPGRFEGPRARTAFQVDRALFDEILLKNAQERGCEIHRQTQVVKVERTGDRVDGLGLADGTQVRADYYVDASGAAATLRRAMEVPVAEKTTLKNVAFWDYWENTEWAVTVGAGATRILVLSVSWGWIWFIPVGPKRTSVGLVVPAKYYKESALSPEAIYLKALEEEPKIRELTKDATREGVVRGTKDWSFLCRRLAGENWFLCGEVAGFADPILSAGVTLAMSGGRELAHTLIALQKGSHDADWLKQCYDENQRTRINQHIRFADFWYSANGQFSDLKDFTREIAEEAGLVLDANEAFRWLGTGGFTNDITQLPAIADISVTGMKQLAQRFTETQADWALNGASVLKLNVEGAEQRYRPSYQNGSITKIRTLERKGKVLPFFGFYGLVLDAIRAESSIEGIARRVVAGSQGNARDPLPFLFQLLEAWVTEGWLIPSSDARFPSYSRVLDSESGVIHSNRDISM